MKKILFIGMAFVSLLFLGCMSVKANKTYEAEELKAIKNWNVGFEYGSVRIEQKTGGKEKEISEGHPVKDTKFLNDLYYGLKESGKVNVAKNGNEGNILINISRKYGEDDELSISCDVTFTNKENLELGRMSLKSTHFHLIHVSQEKFVRYVTEEIILKLTSNL